jgi:hypothetical protein
LDDRSGVMVTVMQQHRKVDSNPLIYPLVRF